MSVFRDCLPTRPLRGMWRFEDETCDRCGGWADRIIGGERLCYVCGERVEWATSSRPVPDGSP